VTGTRWWNKDRLGAGLIIVLGAAIGYAGKGYGVGSFEHMGSGFVPLVIGLALVGVGLLLGLAAVLAPGGENGSPHMHHMGLDGLPDLRGGLCIVAGVVAFVILGDHGGLVPATFASVFISALGDRKNSVRDALLLACAMVGLALLVFSWALDVQMPAFGWR
jgi:putative tricarboxylic transport membrane protein